MKKRIQLIAGIAALILGVFVLKLEAQSPKGKYGTFALTNATIETVTKGRVENGTVVISDGKITAVGAGVPVPQGAEVIDCKGRWIYPGMIDSGTRLGLSEVGSDPRTRDFNEVGDIIPQMRALSAVNPNSSLIPVTRISGVTTVIAAPEGDLIPGTAALINLYGYTPEQMFGGFEGVVLVFPNTTRAGFFDRRTDEEIRKASEKAIQKLNDTWDMAIQFHKLDSATKSKGIKYQPEMLALLPVVRGDRTLMIQANA
jgi:hypothetical protein